MTRSPSGTSGIDPPIPAAANLPRRLDLWRLIGRAVRNWFSFRTPPTVAGGKVYVPPSEIILLDVIGQGWERGRECRKASARRRQSDFGRRSRKLEGSKELRPSGSNVRSGRRLTTGLKRVHDRARKPEH